MGTPIKTETPIAITAIKIVVLAPNNNREYTSDPIRSVPKKCSKLGAESL